MIESNDQIEEKSEICGNEGELNFEARNSDEFDIFIASNDYIATPQELPTNNISVADPNSTHIGGEAASILSRCDMYVEAIRCLRSQENYSEEARTAAMYVYFRKTTPINAIRTFKQDFTEILQSQRTLPGLNVELGKNGFCDVLMRLLDETFSVATSAHIYPHHENSSPTPNAEITPSYELNNALEELIPSICDSIRLFCRVDEMEIDSTITVHVTTLLQKGMSTLSMKILKHYHALLLTQSTANTATISPNIFTILVALLNMLAMGLLPKEPTHITEFMKEEPLLPLILDLLGTSSLHGNLPLMTAILRLLLVIASYDWKALSRAQGKIIVIQIELLLKQTTAQLMELVIPPQLSDEHVLQTANTTANTSAVNETNTIPTDTTPSESNLTNTAETDNAWVANFDNVPMIDETKKDDIAMRLKMIGLISAIAGHIIHAECSLLPSLLETNTTFLLQKTSFFYVVFDQLFTVYDKWFLHYDVNWIEWSRIIFFVMMAFYVNSSTQKYCLEHSLWNHVNKCYDLLLQHRYMNKERFIIALSSITLLTWPVVNKLENEVFHKQRQQQQSPSTTTTASILQRFTISRGDKSAPSETICYLSSSTKQIIHKLFEILRNYRFKNYHTIELLNGVVEVITNFKCIQKVGLISTILGSSTIIPGVQGLFDEEDAFFAVCEIFQYYRALNYTISQIVLTGLFTTCPTKQANTIGTVWNCFDVLLERMCDNKYSIAHQELFASIVSQLSTYCDSTKSYFLKTSPTEQEIAMRFKNAILFHYDNFTIQRQLFLAMNNLIRLGLKKGTRSFSGTLSSKGFWDIAIIFWDRYIDLPGCHDIALQSLNLISLMIRCDQNAILFTEPLAFCIPTETKEIKHEEENEEEEEFEEFQQAHIEKNDEVDNKSLELIEEKEEIEIEASTNQSSTTIQENPATASENEDGCTRCKRTLEANMPDATDFSNTTKCIAILHNNMTVRKHFHQDPTNFAVLYQGFVVHYYPISPTSKHQKFLLQSVVQIIQQASALGEEVCKHLLANYPIANLLVDIFAEKAEKISSANFLSQDDTSHLTQAIGAVNNFCAWPSCKTPFVTSPTLKDNVQLIIAATPKNVFNRQQALQILINVVTEGATPPAPVHENANVHIPSTVDTNANQANTSQAPLSEQARATVNQMSRSVGQTVSRFSSFFGRSTQSTSSDTIV